MYLFLKKSNFLKMRLRRLFIFLSLIFFINNVNALYHDVALLLDYNNEELPLFDQDIDLISGKNAITNNFAFLIDQKAAPIICSGSIIYNFLFRRAWFENKIKNNEKLETAYLQYYNIYAKNYNDIWEKFQNRDDLTIPLKKKLDDSKLKTKNIFDSLLDSTYKNYYHLQAIEENCFFYSTNFKFNDWYIYKHKNTDLYLFISKEYLQKRNEEEFNLKEMGFNDSCVNKIDDLSIDNIESNINNSEFSPNYLKQFFLKDDFSWNIYMFGHGAQLYICGMLYIYFKDFLIFLEENLNVNLFFYSSCLAASEECFHNVYNSGGLSTLKFPIVSCLIDSSIENPMPYNQLTLKRSYLKYVPSFNLFFNSLHDDDYIERLPFIFKNITSNIPLLSDLHGITQSCFVRLPGEINFEPILSYDDLTVISDDLEEKICIDNKRAIFINTEKDINNLKINAYKKNFFDFTPNDEDYKSPAIVSIIPGNSTHRINKIDVNVPFEKFINETFYSIPEGTYKKEFIIKSLKCADIEYSNISIFPNERRCEI